MIGTFFGGEFIKLAREGNGIDPELANCFKFVEPTKPQVGDYLRNMLKRYGFDQIDLQKELPLSYQQPNNEQQPPPPSPAQNNGDAKFDYSNMPPSQGGGGFFDNPNNMAGQSNWGKFLGPNYSQNNNLNINPNDMGKLAPSRIDEPGFNQNNNPYPPVNPNMPPNTNPNPPKNKEEEDFDQMLKDLQEGSIVKDGNELVNPSMSQMKLGSKTKPPKDDFDDLINSLQGNVVADLSKQQPKKPEMRGPPKRRNKAQKPISSEPEAYQYTDEVDGDTEEKHYDELSLEYRLEEMRNLKV
jgi:hypothetical protein